MKGIEFFEHNALVRPRLFLGVAWLAICIILLLSIVTERGGLGWPSSCMVGGALVWAGFEWWTSLREYDRVAELGLKTMGIEPRSPLSTVLEVAARGVQRSFSPMCVVFFMLMAMRWWHQH